MGISNEQLTRDWSRFAWGGVGIVLVALIAFVAFQWRSVTAPKPPPPIAGKLELPSPTTPVATVSPPVPKPLATAGAKALPPVVPSFDIVRVDPNGNAVLAGRAKPESEVTIYDSGKPVGSVTADKDGNWVLIPEQPLPSGQGQLTLSAKARDGALTHSEGTVAMLVPDRPGSAAASRAGSSGNAEEPLAILVPKEGHATILNLPPLKNQNGLSMDTVQYGNKGDVILEGRTAPGARVDAFLNTKKVGATTAGQDGNWQIVTTENVPPGRYNLKLESRNKAGKPVAKLTIPFERASVPEKLAHGLVIVQPGNSLWRIARHSYGRGVLYVEIYHANQRQINDPDLIYPGQLLAVPGRS